MKFWTFISFVAVVAVIFVIEVFSPNSFDFKKFSTAKGEIDIKEIEKNVFEIYGYTLIKNGLIPILKKKNEMTCNKIFSEWQKVADNGLTINPPREIPNPTNFLLNNYTKLLPWYFNETPKNTKESLKNWNQTYIDNLIKMAKENPLIVPHSYEGDALAVYAATKDFAVDDQIGAVIGSQKPWAEVYLLANGAKHVTTVDYYKLSINNPQMNFLYAPDLPSIIENYYGKFDFVVSFSSIEHSGLGRYGDPIDPIGDIREMNKIHCMLKSKGLLFLGFPVGVDTIYFNAHRIYGRIRLAMMFEGFKLLKIYWQQKTVTQQQMFKIFNNQIHQEQFLFVLEKV